MFDYETLKVIWWLLVGVLLIGFAIMDGHDMGVGTLLPFVGRNDTERRVIINTVGPHWDGNQVWFITAGGAIFAAWPLVYATAFSGFYWAMLVVLFALFFRPVGFDYRSKIADPRWRSDLGLGPVRRRRGAAADLRRRVRQPAAGRAVPLRRTCMARSTPARSGSCSIRSRCSAGVVSSGDDHVPRRDLPGAPHRGRHPAARAIRRRADRSAALLLARLRWRRRLACAGIDGYVITSAVDPAALPNPLGKTVVREAGAWFANYGRHPLDDARLPALGLCRRAGRRAAGPRAARR